MIERNTTIRIETADVLGIVSLSVLLLAPLYL